MNWMHLLELDLVDLPLEKVAIWCRRVYKITTFVVGLVVQYKTRFIVKGFPQEYGIDYDEIFSPGALLTSIRYLFSICALY